MEINDIYTDADNIEIELVAENSMEVFFNFGLSVSVNISMGMLRYAIAIPRSLKESTNGLLGNFNGDFTDDLISPDGTTYNISSEQEIFAFTESCKLINTTNINALIYVYTLYIGKVPDVDSSLFMDPNPDPDPSFVPESVEAVVIRASQEVIDACGGNQHCIYDTVQTDNIEVGLETMRIQEDIRKDIELAGRSKCCTDNILC